MKFMNTLPSVIALAASLCCLSATQAQTSPELIPASAYTQPVDEDFLDADDFPILEDLLDEELLTSGLLKEGLRVEDILVKNFRYEDILAEGVGIEDIERFFEEKDANDTFVLTMPSIDLDDWFSQQYLYTPFSIHYLSAEEKAKYLALIQQFWPWNYTNMQASEVNNIMAGIINTMLEEINRCSRGLAAMEVLTNFITGGPKSPKDWANFIRKNHEAIGQALGQINKNRMYRICINNAARNYKSAFDEAYRIY